MIPCHFHIKCLQEEEGIISRCFNRWVTTLHHQHSKTLSKMMISSSKTNERKTTSIIMKMVCVKCHVFFLEQHHLKRLFPSTKQMLMVLCLAYSVLPAASRGGVSDIYRKQDVSKLPVILIISLTFLRLISSLNASRNLHRHHHDRTMETTSLVMESKTKMVLKTLERNLETPTATNGVRMAFETQMEDGESSTTLPIVMVSESRSTAMNLD